MNSSQTFRSLRFAAATAAVAGLVFAAASAQAMPVKSPHERFTVPAYGATASSGPSFTLPTVGRDTGHTTANPAVGAHASKNPYQSDVPVLGRERARYRSSGTRLNLTFAHDGRAEQPTSIQR